MMVVGWMEIYNLDLGKVLKAFLFVKLFVCEIIGFMKWNT